MITQRADPEMIAVKFSELQPTGKLVSQNFLKKSSFLENGKLLGFLASAQETGRDAEGVVDGDGDAAFTRAVELGDDEAVERAGFMKFLRLVQGVGAGGGIDDKQSQMRCGFVLFGEGAADFSEFLHQVMSGVDAAGGIADEELSFLGDGLLVGVEADGGWVGVGISGDYGEVQACAPALELLDCCGAEGIGGCE